MCGCPHTHPRRSLACAPLPLALSHFVPNLTLGAPVVKSLRRALVAMATPAYLDVHLMVTSPAQWLDDFADAGASGFTFHIEAVGALAASRIYGGRRTLA